MFSSPSPDCEDFERLGLDDMPPTTRQQEREGRTQGTISYCVNFVRDYHPSTINYELGFEPPHSLLAAVAEQGENISHVVQVELDSGGLQQHPRYLIELQEKVTVSVYDGVLGRDNPRLLYCDCSHQTDRRACKHVSFIIDQLLQCDFRWRLRNSRPRNSYAVTMNAPGTKAGYRNGRGSWVYLSPFSVIGAIGQKQVANGISEIRCNLDAVQSLDYRHERIKKYFHGLDEHALRGVFLAPYQAQSSDPHFTVSERDCADELHTLEAELFKVWEGLSRGGSDAPSIASQKLIPTLLFLLKGVIVRHQGEVRDGNNVRILQSCDLFSWLIGQADRSNPFVLRILRLLPAGYATDKQRREKQDIARMIQRLNASVGLQTAPSIRFQNGLEMVWT